MKHQEDKFRYVDYSDTKPEMNKSWYGVAFAIIYFLATLFA